MSPFTLGIMAGVAVSLAASAVCWLIYLWLYARQVRRERRS